MSKRLCILSDILCVNLQKWLQFQWRILLKILVCVFPWKHFLMCTWFLIHVLVILQPFRLDVSLVVDGVLCVKDTVITTRNWVLGSWSPRHSSAESQIISTQPHLSAFCFLWSQLPTVNRSLEADDSPFYSRSMAY